MLQKIFTVLKLILLISTSTLVLRIQNWELTLVACIAIISFAFVLQAKRFPHERILPLIFIALLIIIFQVLFNTTEPYIVRIALGAIAAAKITSVSLLVFLFTASTSINSIMFLCNIFPRNLRLILTITFGIIPAVMEETRNIKLIQSARGLHTKSFNPYKSFLPIIIPVLHRSFQRAERIAILLETRGL